MTDFCAGFVSKIEGLFVEVFTDLRANDIVGTHKLSVFQTLIEPPMLRLPVIGCNLSGFTRVDAFQRKSRKFLFGMLFGCD
jgi:hypothetical protein